MEGPPNLVVEIFSESTQHRDVGVKQQVYERYGVSHYWRVDPVARTLVELVAKNGRYSAGTTYQASDTFRSALFPNLAIELTQVFPTAE